MSVIAIMVVGVSCIIIPEAKTVSSLIFPHFCLGLGIGILDASLVPYLAWLADSIIANHDDASEATDDSSSSNYGSVYAIQQTAVSLAYSIGKAALYVTNYASSILSFFCSSISRRRVSTIYGLFSHHESLRNLQLYLWTISILYHNEAQLERK